MAYIFDTNVFIRSKNDMPMDLWPTFWNKLTEMVNSGVIFSSSMVKDEINHGKDELTEWLKNNAPKSFYISLDADIINNYQQTQLWAQNQYRFTIAALQTFANVADAYLVATAITNNLTLVTYEKSNLQSKKRVMIPDVCNAFGVKCCDFNTVLREMGITI
jgi:predicted nucleic acid-binding protein